MIMAPCDFAVTPQSYNRQYSLSFRQKKEEITFADVDRARRKVRKWMADNAQHFPV